MDYGLLAVRNSYDKKCQNTMWFFKSLNLWNTLKVILRILNCDTCTLCLNTSSGIFDLIIKNYNTTVNNIPEHYK